MKLVKGSLQAKRYMASIRSKKKRSIGAVGDYAKFEIAVIKKLATLLKQPYKKTQETVNTSETLLNIISVNFDKKISVNETAKQLKLKLIEVNKKSPIQSFVELLSKLPKKETQSNVKFPIKLPATVTIGGLLRKAKINGLPINFQASFRGQPFYIVNQYDIYGNVVLELMDKNTNSKFGTISNNSKVDFIIDEFILWLSSKGVNFYTDKEIKEIHKQIKPLATNLVKEVKDFNKGTKQPKVKKQVVKKQVVKKVKVQRLRPSKVSSKTSILKESNLIRQRLKDKKMIMPHGYQVKRSVLNGVKNDKFLSVSNELANLSIDIALLKKQIFESKLKSQKDILRKVLRDTQKSYITLKKYSLTLL
jgi:hypothetical protein